MIIANTNDEIGFALRHIGKYFEGSVVVQESQREDAIFAGIVIANARNVWLGKDQRCARWRVFVNSRDVTAAERREKMSVTLKVHHNHKAAQLTDHFRSRAANCCVPEGRERAERSLPLRAAHCAPPSLPPQ